MKSNENRKSWGIIGGIILLAAAALVLLGVFGSKPVDNDSPQKQNRQVRSKQDGAKEQNRTQKKKREKIVSAKVVSDEVSIEQKRTQEKLKNIFHPKVVFDEVPISAAIDHLELLSKELDPEQTGVKIVLDNTVDPAGKTVTMAMKNIPLDIALKYICKTTNLQYKIEPDGVIVITP